MNDAVPDCLIKGYEPLIEGIRLPDPKDRHVLAAAIQGHAAVIVTYNLRDFPQETLKSFGIIAGKLIPALEGLDALMTVTQAR